MPPMETMVYGVEYGPSVVQLSEQVSLLSSLVDMVVKIESRFFSNLNGQFIIVYTGIPHLINHEYSLVIITPRIFNQFSVLKYCI